MWCWAELKPLGLGLPEFVSMRILSSAPDSPVPNSPAAPSFGAGGHQVLRALEDRGALSRPPVTPAGRAMRPSSPGVARRC